MGKLTYLDKVALNENPDIPDINKVKASDMNEIKSSVNTLYDNQGDLSSLQTTTKSSLVGAVNELKSGGVYSSLLWTNPNPTSNFPSSGNRETINLKSDDYDFIIWVCSDNNKFDSPGGCFIYFKGLRYINFNNAVGSSGSQIYNIFRYVERVNDTTFNISRCFKYRQSGGSTSLSYEDKTLLPIYAIGFKTGLFS